MIFAAHKDFLANPIHISTYKSISRFTTSFCSEKRIPLLKNIFPYIDRFLQISSCKSHIILVQCLFFFLILKINKRSYGHCLFILFFSLWVYNYHKLIYIIYSDENIIVLFNLTRRKCNSIIYLFFF